MIFTGSMRCRACLQVIDLGLVDSALTLGDGGKGGYTRKLALKKGGTVELGIASAKAAKQGLTSTAAPAGSRPVGDGPEEFPARNPPGVE